MDLFHEISALIFLWFPLTCFYVVLAQEDIAPLTVIALITLGTTLLFGIMRRFFPCLMFARQRAAKCVSLERSVVVSEANGATATRAAPSTFAFNDPADSQPDGHEWHPEQQRVRTDSCGSRASTSIVPHGMDDAIELIMQSHSRLSHHSWPEDINIAFRSTVSEDFTHELKIGCQWWYS